ncbi:MAG: serine hydrolase [Proteobacteria bacterium]|nr:serine hydrolase [Pseudomonadota bacterium]
MDRFLPWLAAFLIAPAFLLPGACCAARELLTYEALMRGSYPHTVDLSAYTPDAAAVAATNTFEGTLRLTGQPHSRVLRSDAAFVEAGGLAQARTLPRDFAYEFVQSGGELIPVRRGALASSHGWWEFILEPGRVWNEPGDHGYSRAAIPFSLQERNANCTHNGVLMFLFRDDGRTSRAALQVSSETCYYLSLDLWASLRARYHRAPVAARAAIIGGYRAEVARRLPVRPLAELGSRYPEVKVAELALGAASARTVYGMVVQGVHYASGCATRSGDYPDCEVLDLPSYSTAKSVFAALALMRLQALGGTATSQPIGRWVPACRDAGWEAVTFADALDMATGHYDSPAFEQDENDAKTQGLFLPPDHASKIQFACRAYPRKAAPGTRWVYHTSDTYLLGTAMNAYLKSLPGHAGSDLFDDLLVADLFGPLGLSPVTAVTRRTYDAQREPFAGWGLTYHRDDIARLGSFLDTQEGRIDGAAVLDAGMLATALQENAADRGLPAADLAGLRYKYGFWARDVKSVAGCDRPTWVPFMSGFGGISVVLFPRGIVYYNFSDDGAVPSFDWGKVAAQVRRIADYCR